MDLVEITPASDGPLVVSVIVDPLDMFPPSSPPAQVLPEAIRVLEDATRHREIVCLRCGSTFTANESGAGLRCQRRVAV